MKWIINVLLVAPPSYLTYIKLCTLVKRNESMAHTLQAKLKEPEADENKRGPRPQDLIRLYDIILQVNVWTSSTTCILRSFYRKVLYVWRRCLKIPLDQNVCFWAHNVSMPYFLMYFSIISLKISCFSVHHSSCVVWSVLSSVKGCVLSLVCHSQCNSPSLSLLSPPFPSSQSLAELSTLQGLEDDHTFQKEVSLKTLVYKAYRSDINLLKRL